MFLKTSALALFLAMAVSGCTQQRELTGQTAPPQAEAEPAQPAALPASEAETVAVGEQGGLTPPAGREGWQVTASTQEKAFTAAKAVDGLRSTRWSSEWDDDQWWMVDFAKEQPLEKITLVWEDAHAASYQVQLSRDGETWTDVHVEESGDGGTDTIEFERQSARFVRLLCGRRATQWGFSLYEVLFNDLPKLAVGASASSGTGAYEPKMAVDGDYGTRWSSNFGDDEWWMVQFERPQVVAGLKIVWETAFGEKYRVLLSDDGFNWKKVYEVKDGDGQVDILFFEPTEASYLKLEGIQRGTGWGYSIWEIGFFVNNERPEVRATSFKQGEEPERALDGNPETTWSSAGAGTQDIRIDLPRAFNLGGAEITWGDEFPTEYAVDLSPDGVSWSTVFETSEGNGGKDYVFFPATETTRVRIQCRQSASGKGYQLALVEFKDGGEKATPIREYKDAAKEAPRGWYPMWLLREQEFWNVVGVIDDWHESLIGETGVIEPYKGGFSVLPLIASEGKLITWADVPLEQSLEEDTIPMPTVRWNPEGWSLEVSAVAFGPLDKSTTAVRYRFTNKSDAPFKGQLALAVRPVQVNPVWQHGGMSPIHEAECVQQGASSFIRINGKPKIVSLTAPAAMGAVPIDKGDIVEYIARGELPETQKAADGPGRTSAGLLYDLDVAPGASKDVVVAYLLHDDSKLKEALIQDPEAGFEAVWADERKAWSDLLNKFSITIPEQRLINIMKSNIAYILINKDGPWCKPGPRNYAHAWIRDGAMTSVALMRMGLRAPIKKYIQAYTPLVNHEGWAPYIVMEGGNPVAFNGNPDGGEGHEFDSQGQYVFLVRQYVDFTGDRALLEEVYPKVVQALRYSQKIRSMRMTDEYKNNPDKQAYYGILPHSNSHEGYYPAQHSYWDDFWMLRGWKDGVYLANLMGKPDDVVWMREEEQDLRRCLLASIRKVMERDHIDYIPGCVEKGDFDATSTAIAIMACGERDHLPQPYLQNTFDKYFKEFERGTQPGNERTFTPYEVRSADAFVRMRQRDRALAMLRYFTEESVRPYGWNHLAEVVHARPRAASYIGDMPHTWVGSGYISAVRSLFAYEHEGRLILGAGIDAKWLGQGVTVKDLPTQFGKLNYRMEGQGEEVMFYAEGQAAPPKGFELLLPEELADMSLEINGQAAEVKDGVVEFASLPATIRLFNQ